MHSSKRDMLSARNTSLYSYGTYHTRMVRYNFVYHTRMVYKIVPYAYGIKYAYGTEHQFVQPIAQQLVQGKLL